MRTLVLRPDGLFWKSYLDNVGKGQRMSVIMNWVFQLSELKCDFPASITASRLVSGQKAVISITFQIVD